MADNVRSVSVVPIVKVKREPLSEEEDEEAVSCKLCCKNFANEVALRNHARMEHMDAYANGDPLLWTNVTPPKKSITYVKEEGVEQRTKELIASMEATSIMRLASKDVSYIIVKSEDGPEPAKKKRGDRDKREKQAKAATPRKEREAQPITGPFECLQPSALVADGTCHRIFFSCCEYSLHYRDEHTRRRRGPRCQVCEKPLALAAGPDKPHGCDTCGAAFGSAEELSAHAGSHVRPKPYECGECRKRFTQLAGLQQHSRMHSGLRPFGCPVCPKSFTQKSGLEQHLRIHTKVRPYRCVVCAKSFSQSVHLKQHMRTHTNVAPFQCGICEKRFKQSSHLNYHLRCHDPAAMSDEQRAKYARLAGVLSRAGEGAAVEAVDAAEAVETVEAVESMEAMEAVEVVDASETWCVTLA
ncbi:unnamed protein product, partial [Iphiclides podalirius]